MIILIATAALAAAHPAAPASDASVQHGSMAGMATMAAKPAAKDDCCCKDMMAKMNDGHAMPHKQPSKN